MGEKEEKEQMKGIPETVLPHAVTNSDIMHTSVQLYIMLLANPAQNNKH